MELTNRNRPVLLIHPNQDSNFLTSKAIELTEELTDILGSISFEDSKASEIVKVIKVCKRGIERITQMEGSTFILSNDSIKVESILNETIEILAGALNEAMLELKKRSLQGEDLFTYVEQLDAMIDTCLSWSQGKAETLEQSTTNLLDEDDLKFL